MRHRRGAEGSSDAAALDYFYALPHGRLKFRSLLGGIFAVVGTTMQPFHASVWLRSRPYREQR